MIKRIKPIKLLKEVIVEALKKSNEDVQSVPGILLHEAIRNSAEFAKNHMKDSMMFFNHAGIWDYTISQIIKQTFKGYLLEFGVFKGTSINYFSNAIKTETFYGFDSFEGLQEDWKGWSLRKGAFDLNGVMPNVNPNVKLIKGWFDQTIPTFLNTQTVEHIRLLHIDCDTYEATKTVFEQLNKEIKTGTLILFDEFFGYRGWEIGEFKAFNEFVIDQKINFKFLAFSNCQVLVEII
jgi:hypothetical protein